MERVEVGAKVVQTPLIDVPYAIFPEGPRPPSFANFSLACFGVSNMVLARFQGNSVLCYRAVPTAQIVPRS